MTAWLKSTARVTGPPVEGLGKTTGVVWEMAVGLAVGEEVAVVLAVVVGVAVAAETVTEAPGTFEPPTKPTRIGWPFVPVPPVMLKVYCPMAPELKSA